MWASRAAALLPQSFVETCSGEEDRRLGLFKLLVDCRRSDKESLQEIVTKRKQLVKHDRCGTCEEVEGVVDLEEGR